MLGASLGELRLALHGQGDAAGDEQFGALPLVTGADTVASPPSADVITREELVGIEKKKPTTERRVQPPVYVYRANELESVRP